MRHEAKWPISHRDRIIELRALENDPTQALFRKDISAAIAFHRGFQEDELCSPGPRYFQGGREVAANECHGLFWVEVS